MGNLSNFVKRVRDIMRNDAGINGDAQRIEQIAWMLFLKVYDTKEDDWEWSEKDYQSIIPEPCRWRNWAHDENGKGITGDTLLEFVNNTLFPTLKKLPVDASTPIKKAIVQTTFADAKWDGTTRISRALHRFLGAAKDELTTEALKIFLLGAIKRVFHPGCKFEMMLCLVGGQGAGKSSFFRLLAIKDEWFSDDLRRLDDDNVFRKLQGHWIMEMSEMIATANAKSIEEIKSFLSKQKETYKIPYETHPADRLRQCVFAGTTNRQDFLPRDRTGNRRFIPIPVDAAQAEVHILDNEAESRAYIDQLWAEAMTIYNSGDYKLTFSPAMQEALQICQKDFMQEDTQAGMIYAFLEDYTGDRVCSKQLYAEALGNLNLPAEWETRAICEIMTAGIANDEIKGWTAHKAAKRYPKYGVQKGWERVTAAKADADGFVKLTDEEAQQMGVPF